MDYFLPKPFVLPQLKQILVHNLKTSFGAAVPTSGPAQAALEAVAGKSEAALKKWLVERDK